MKSKDKVQEILRLAGVTVNGGKPWDIRVRDESFYGRVLSGGSLALGESYMDGWWDAEALDQFFYRILRAELTKYAITPSAIMHYFLGAIFNFQTKSRAGEVGKKHYDIGNRLYELMLGPSMTYSCGYWKDAKDLDSAQYAKLDLICRKINLKPGMKVLDIGCGWGSFMKHAAEKYGVEATGVTISEEQLKLGQRLCSGLPVEFKLMDYRDIEGRFDRVVSIGMFEHVGPKNYRTFMDIVKRSLIDDGVFLLHTIGRNISAPAGDPWISKHIFPNGILPSLPQISQAAQKPFVLEDLHNFGADYDLTLMAWFENFDRNWHEIKKDYDERFYRMWKFYLLSCAGAFRARKIQLWQFVFSNEGLAGGYRSIR
ncbi:MAG: cyclopropane fatty acyl phospholipid synthase [Candidatus Doudnabacteria bacterium]|nr:cyclopropane fatty acyl phospholipid synthase [Candidatus Doudnabacteria bacterium]